MIARATYLAAIPCILTQIETITSDHSAIEARGNRYRSALSRCPGLSMHIGVVLKEES